MRFHEMTVTLQPPTKRQWCCQHWYDFYVEIFGTKLLPVTLSALLEFCVDDAYGGLDYASDAINTALWYRGVEVTAWYGKRGFR